MDEKKPIVTDPLKGEDPTPVTRRSGDMDCSKKRKADDASVANSSDESNPIAGTDLTTDTKDSAAQGKSQVVYRGYVTFENGSNVDGPRQKATICVDNQSNVITVSVDKPVSVFVAPGYPIVIEGPLPEMEETEAQSCREVPVQNPKKKGKDIFF